MKRNNTEKPYFVPSIWQEAEGVINIVHIRLIAHENENHTPFKFRKRKTCETVSQISSNCGKRDQPQVVSLLKRPTLSRLCTWGNSATRLMARTF
jgi:hypothetical protein